MRMNELDVTMQNLKSRAETFKIRKPFNASLMQCRKAYETQFNQSMPMDMQFSIAAMMVVVDFCDKHGKAGEKMAIDFVQGQSNEV